MSIELDKDQTSDPSFIRNDLVFTLPLAYFSIIIITSSRSVAPGLKNIWMNDLEATVPFIKKKPVYLLLSKVLD